MWSSIAIVLAVASGSGCKGPGVVPSGGHYLSKSYGGGTGKRPWPHKGIDYAGPTGTKVIAPADGEVLLVDVHDDMKHKRVNCGKQFTIFHTGAAQGLMTKYCHLNRMGVHEGQRVRKGQRLGSVGTSGCEPVRCVPHLHFEVWKGSRHVDPESEIGGCYGDEETRRSAKLLVYPIEC